MKSTEIMKFTYNNVDKNVVFCCFVVNESLTYLIKSLTGDSEDEILSYFYEIGVKIFQDCVSRKVVPQRCNRQVNIFYKDTDVCVKLVVLSSYFESSFMGVPNRVGLQIEITLPYKFRVVEGESFSRSVLENNLGFSEEKVLSIERPKEKLYRFMRKTG